MKLIKFGMDWNLNWHYLETIIKAFKAIHGNLEIIINLEPMINTRISWTSNIGKIKIRQFGFQGYFFHLFIIVLFIDLLIQDLTILRIC